jgi:hypothetical protein
VNYLGSAKERREVDEEENDGVLGRERASLDDAVWISGVREMKRQRCEGRLRSGETTTSWSSGAEA